MLCQQCKKQTATVHLTDLAKNEKRERHLCEECAAREGIAVKQHVSINDVLNQFLQSRLGRVNFRYVDYGRGNMQNGCTQLTRRGSSTKVC